MMLRRSVGPSLALAGALWCVAVAPTVEAAPPPDSASAIGAQPATPAPPQPPQPPRAPQPPQPPRAAQPPQPEPAPPDRPPPAPPAEERFGQPVNVRVMLKIIDQREGAKPVEKQLTLTVADGMQGLIRSQTLIPNRGELPLHVDVVPRILEAGKIRLRLVLNYDLPENIDASPTPGEPLKTQIREQIGVVLDSGKPMIVAQSADPIVNRQVTVEVTATILR